jgi:anaerobic magnesium-protoporphyrin IX monomethyl ester cyclase
MLSVLDLLINHSYLADQMRAMLKEGREMPAEVKSILDTVSKHKRDKHQVIAPIP